MAKYLIHACKVRLWYVNEYLIPSMIKQGINKADIDIYLDENEEGCLFSCMKAFYQVPNNDEGIWHLQDDIVIASNFKEKTEKYSQDYIVCGYCYSLDGGKDFVGEVKPKNMWYSFPCIYIPNKVAKRCASWFFNKAMYDNGYGVLIRTNKHDDTLFHVFVEDYYSEMKVLNLVPNIVDHVDYLIGGSIINRIRPEKETHAAYFEEEILVKNLEKLLTYE